MTTLRILVRILILLWVSLGWMACASQGGSGTSGTPAKSAAKAKYTTPPASSPLSKITLGMNDTQVRKILGEPDNANAYMTGKAWIPFYYGPDTLRTDWMYRGKGRVVFSRNRYSGSLKVIRVLYNPNELM